ncbi:MAG: hypothetical protein M1833_000030 [Piccolia ochrophora]|nr:MAG: hypothetical protein M1833_000030 [Piccolia ochrophora]
MKSPLPPSIVQLSQQFKKQPGSLQLADLESALARLFQEFHKSFVIIDALDECEGVNNRKDFLQFLRSLEGTSVRVFVTSRPYLDDIKKTLSSSPHLKIEARDSDIEKYIINRIAKEEAIEDLIDESLKEEMIHTIVTGAQGMFLLPALQIQAILDQTSRTQIRNALKRMPKTLESVFEETLQRMQRQPESRATLGKKTLMWISHAKRLLLVEELRQALAVNLEDDQFDSDNSPTAKRIVDSCLGLVTINEEDATVRLVHYSVQEYLIQQRQILFDLGDQIIAKTCLAFLSFEIFEENKTLIPADSDLELCSPLEGEVTEAAGSELSDDGDSGGEFTSGRDSEEEYTYSGDSNKAEVTQDDDFNAQHDPKEAAEKIYNEKTNPDNRWPQYPLFNYAACYWGDHARTEPEGIVDSVYTFLQGPYKTTCAGLLLQKTRLNAYKRSMNVPILHLLSFLGLATIMKRLLDEGAKANSKSFAGQTPLMWAAKEGQILAAKSLLAQWDVEVNSRDVWSETALTHACLNGHPPLVKLLLEHGADVNARSPFIGTVLHEYVRIGDYAMTKLLLISGADVSATDDQRRVAIFHAAENGDERLIRLLITHGANLNVRDNSGNTVLHLAVLRRNFEATRLLLQVRVNVAIHNHLGKSAVHDAAGHSYEITRLLLDHGADIEMKDNQRRTALFEAITRRLEASVQLLLERGASIDVQDSIGDTGLHKAARRGFGAIVRLLLKNGADVKTKNGVGETALHSAASGDYYWDAILGSLRRIYSSHALRLQSRKRSRSNERYKEDLRETDLEYESIIQQLLEKGADLQAKDRNELTPLQRAIQNEHEGAVKLLTAASRGFGVH